MFKKRTARHDVLEEAQSLRADLIRTASEVQLFTSRLQGLTIVLQDEAETALNIKPPDDHPKQGGAPGGPRTR